MDENFLNYLMKMICDTGLALTFYYQNSGEEITCLFGSLGPYFGLKLKPLKN